MANILQKPVYSVGGAGGKPHCPSLGARKHYALSCDERRRKLTHQVAFLKGRLRHEKLLARRMGFNTERKRLKMEVDA